jgi:D-glycero-D-manno-heptose 1,7-bisphosphate phosphatase
MTDEKLRPAVFLDRDGTICEEVGYLSNPAQLILIPGSAEAIRELNQQSMFAVVTTNQSGVARGYFTEADVAAVHARLRELLAEKGAKVDAIYYCPHHAEKGLGPYRVACRCRKPQPGMIERAAGEFPVDLENSYVVGDKLSDVEFGKGNGLRSVLVLTGFGREELEKISTTSDVCRPDFVAENLWAAVHWIINDLGKRGVLGL